MQAAWLMKLNRSNQEATPNVHPALMGTPSSINRRGMSSGRTPSSMVTSGYGVIASVPPNTGVRRVWRFEPGDRRRLSNRGD